MAALEQWSTNPYPLLAELRSAGPVAWVNELDAWVVTRYDVAVDVMRDAKTFTVDDPRFTTGQVIGPSMLSLDGTEHARHREPFVPAYRPRAIEHRVRDWIVARAHAIVDTLHSEDTIELRSQLAAPLAAETVLMTLGLDAEPDEALTWYRDIVDAVTDLSGGLPMPPAGPRAFQDLVAATAATPPNASAVLDLARRSLTDYEVASNVAVVMFGAIETTEGAIANLLWHLFITGSFESASGEQRLLESAIEESLRLEPSASRVDRYATRNTSIGDVTIKRGQLVIVSLTGANRDPVIFGEPDQFAIDRPNAGRHLTFARGAHACLGAHLARLEMAAAVAAVFSRLVNFRFVRNESAGPRGLVFRKAQRIAMERR